MAEKKKKKKKSKDTYANSKTNQNLLAKQEALKKIYEHNRDYLSLTLTLPLGNQALKNVHTNQWLFTDLPKEFSLQNWGTIAKVLNSQSNRWIPYEKNRWYIEAVDINVDPNGKSEMKLTLNAFASSTKTYSDMAKEMQTAYNDAVEKEKQEVNGKNNKDTSNAISTGDNNTIKSGWWGKWVEDWVRKTVGNETDQLKKAKMIYEAFRNHVYYSYYECAPKTHQGNVKYYESAYNDGHLNCGDGANIQCAMYNCAGIKATIMHTNYHFIVRMTINGKYYWTDCAGERGHHDNHGFNEVYGGKGGSNIGTKVTCG